MSEEAGEDTQKTQQNPQKEGMRVILTEEEREVVESRVAILNVKQEKIENRRRKREQKRREQEQEEQLKY